MPVGRKLISNVTYLFLNWFSISIFSLLYRLVIGKTVPPESYGIVATSIQVSAFLAPLLLLGFGTAIVKLIPELLERKREDKIQGMLNYSLKTVSIFTIIVASTMIVFSPIFSFALKLTSEVIWTIAILIILTVFANFFKDFQFGFQNIRRIFLSNFYGHLIKVVLTAFLIYVTLNYFSSYATPYTLALLPLVAFLVCEAIIAISLFNKKFFKISTKPVIDKKLIFKYSFPAIITDLFFVLFNNTQYIILTILKTVEITGLFAVAMTISSTIPIIPTIFSSGLFPIMSQLSGRKTSKSKQLYLMKLILRYALLFVLPIATFLVLFSKYAILFFSKAEYLPATNFLVFLTIAAIFSGIGKLFTSNLYAIGRPKKYRNIWMVVSLFFFFLAIPMTYYFSAMGLTISYLIANVILFILSFIYVKKYLDLRLPLSDIGRIMVSILISVIFLLLIKNYITSFIVAIPFVLIAGFIYLLVLLKINFFLEEDLKLLDFFAEKSPILKKQILRIRELLSKYISRTYH